MITLICITILRDVKEKTLCMFNIRSMRASGNTEESTLNAIVSEIYKITS
jgi:hypothetical protein